MNEKNTQNAVVLTKDTRQYKDTPKGSKRLIRKILAIVACVLMFSTFALNVYADSSTISPRNMMSPVLALDRVYFNQTAYGTSTQFGSPFQLYSVNGSTLNDVVRYPMIKNSAGTAATGYESLYLEHVVTGSYNTTPKTVTTRFATRSPAVFWSLCSYNTTETNWYFNEINFLYNTSIIKPTDNLPTIALNVEEVAETIKLYVTANYSVESVDFRDDVNEILLVDGNYEADGTTFEFNIRDLFPEEYTSDVAITTMHINIRVFSERSQNFVGVPVNDGYFEYTQDFIDTTAIDSRFEDFPVRTVIPESIDGGGFLTWVADALKGLFETPLIPLGDYSISIGTILSTTIGIALVFVFLRFFSGG